MLVIGGKKTELTDLAKKLQMESCSVYNIMESGLTISDLHSLSSIESLSRSEKKEEKMFDVIKKTSQFSITQSVYFD